MSISIDKLKVRYRQIFDKELGVIGNASVDVNKVNDFMLNKINLLIENSYITLLSRKPTHEESNYMLNQISNFGATKKTLPKLILSLNKLATPIKPTGDQPNKMYITSFDKDIYKYNNVELYLSQFNIKATPYIMKNPTDDSIKRGYNTSVARGSYVTSASSYSQLIAHLAILKEAKSQNLNRVIICSDDIILSNDFTQRITKIPDTYDVLYLGAYQKEYTFNKVSHYNGYYRAKYTYGIFAYIVNQNFYDTLISYYEKEQSNIDYILVQLQEEHTFYVMFPNLIIENLKKKDVINTGRLISVSQYPEAVLNDIFKWDPSKYNTEKRYLINDPASKKKLLATKKPGLALDKLINVPISNNTKPVPKQPKATDNINTPISNNTKPLPKQVANNINTPTSTNNTKPLPKQVANNITTPISNNAKSVSKKVPVTDNINTPISDNTKSVPKKAPVTDNIDTSDNTKSVPKKVLVTDNINTSDNDTKSIPKKPVTDNVNIPISSNTKSVPKKAPVTNNVNIPISSDTKSVPKKVPVTDNIPISGDTKSVSKKVHVTDNIDIQSSDTKSAPKKVPVTDNINIPSSDTKSAPKKVPVTDSIDIPSSDTKSAPKKVVTDNIIPPSDTKSIPKVPATDNINPQVITKSQFQPCTDEQINVPISNDLKSEPEKSLLGQSESVNIKPLNLSNTEMQIDIPQNISPEIDNNIIPQTVDKLLDDTSSIKVDRVVSEQPNLVLETVPTRIEEVTTASVETDIPFTETQEVTTLEITVPQVESITLEPSITKKDLQRIAKQDARQRKKQILLATRRLLNKTLLKPGISFLIHSDINYDDSNLQTCIETILDVADEILFFNNNNNVNAVQILKSFNNVFIYNYPNSLNRKTGLNSDVYLNWCLSKVKRYNVIEWNCHYIPIKENIMDMVEKYNLRDRTDPFLLLATGKKIYISNNNNFLDVQKCLYVRAYSKLHKFSYNDTIESQDYLNLLSELFIYEKLIFLDMIHM